MSRQQIALVAGIGAAVVVIAIVAVLVLQAAGRGVALDPRDTATERPTLDETPSARPTPSGEATEEPTEEPTPEASGEILAELAEIEEQVLELRELPRPEIPPAELMSRDALYDELVALFAEDYPEEEQFADNVTLRAMGLLEEGQDIAEIELELLSLGVLGFYDDEDKRIAVVTDVGLDAEARTTYAHEYTHAMQDAAFQIATLELDVAGDDDGAMARLSLLEGDAELTSLLWATQNVDVEDLFGGGGGPPPDLSEIPSWLVEEIIFPYTVGTDFVFTIHNEGGYEAVNAAYEDPPESTEQVIHPELYFADEQPIAVEVPDLAAELGPGWEVVESTPIGEAVIDIVLAYLGASRADSAEAAAGWGGDRLSVAAGPDGEFALVWRLAWDTPADAEEFTEAYEEVLPELGFPAAVLQIDGSTVVVGHASDPEILEIVMDAASR